MKKVNHSEFDLLQNEYIVNQGQVKSLIGKYIKQRNFAFIVMFVVIIASIGITMIALQVAGEAKKVDKVVFKEDGTGGLTYLGLPDSKLKVGNQLYISNQMVEYVTALYSIPTDRNQRQYNILKVQWMTNVQYFNQYPQPLLIEAYNKHGAQLIIASSTLSGENTTGVWEVDWTKTVDGAKVGDFRTLITFKQTDNINGSPAYLYNPLGIVVTGIATQQRFNPANQ